MPTSRSKADWKDLLTPLLPKSVEEASDRLMRTDTIQKWLRRASSDAAERLGRQRGLQGTMDGYNRLKGDFEDRFPELLAAVDEVTGGCGTVDLDWTPTNPALSRVKIVFDREFTVDLFVRLDAPTPEAARNALFTVADALPEGTPFPNRPNTVTGLVAFDGTGVGVRVREHLGDDQQGRYRTVTLLPKNRDPLENLSAEEASSRLLQAVSSADSTSG
jgi:hypothetical protein